MHEGAFRILRALGDRQRRRRPTLARASGEAESVLRELLERYPKWFDEDPDGVRATDVGLAALGTEFAARRPPSLDAAQAEQDQAAFRALAAGRAPLRPELDQVWATPASVLARARHLIAEGEVQRGLVLLGDDDLTSLALAQLGASRGVHVLDVDDALLGFLGTRSTEQGFAIETTLLDVRNPLPPALRGRFGAVFTDPPYADEGFALFLSRAIELTRPDARLYVCFGSSRRAPERGLKKQRLIAEAGLLIAAVLPDFHEYEGAESIGSRSSLYVLEKTPQTRALVAADVEAGSGPLYTRRTPNPEGTKLAEKAAQKPAGRKQYKQRPRGGGA